MMKFKYIVIFSAIMKLVKCTPLHYLNVASKIYGSLMNLSIALTILFAISVAIASQIKFPQIEIINITTIVTRKRISATVMNRINIMLKA